jgi:hypothetical protein
MRTLAAACALLAGIALGGCRAAPDPAPPVDPLGGVEATLDDLERDVTAG